MGGDGGGGVGGDNKGRSASAGAGADLQRPCCVHLAPEDAYCARVDSVVPAFLEVSREVRKVFRVYIPYQ